MNGRPIRSAAGPLRARLRVASLGYDTKGERYQYVVDVPWVPSLDIGFRLGVDGISVAMVVLTSVVIWAGCYVSRSIKDRVKEHYILLLALVTGVFGVFLSLDLFFFYFFYEMAVIPMYLLIGVWGSRAGSTPRSTVRR